MHASILSTKRIAIAIPPCLALIQKDFLEKRVDEYRSGALI